MEDTDNYSWEDKISYYLEKGGWDMFVTKQALTDFNLILEDVNLITAPDVSVSTEEKRKIYFDVRLTCRGIDEDDKFGCDGSGYVKIDNKGNITDIGIIN